MNTHVNTTETSDPYRGAFNFLGLPGEIRNMIYPLLLEGTDPQRFRTSGFRRVHPPVQIRRRIQGLLLPFSHWRLPYRGNTNTEIVPDDPAEVARTIMHACPPILAVNKQTRTEARSLFLQKHLTFELHGIGREWEDKLKGLRCWLKLLSPSEVSSIQRIELRERILVICPDDAGMVRELGTDTNTPWDGVIVQVAAVEISIKNGGKTLEVWSRLEIIKEETIPVKLHLEAVVEEKRQAGKIFSGHDLIALTCWMKVTNEIPRPIYVTYGTYETTQCRWTMLASKADLTWPSSLNWKGKEKEVPRNLKLEFRYLVARVEI